MTRREYAGGAARTTITQSIASSGGGTVTIASATGWPTGGVGKFLINVDPGLSSEEKILIDSRTGTTLTYSAGGRGYDGSTASAHSSGATTWHAFGAIDADEANAHVNATAAAHTGAMITFPPSGTIAAATVTGAIQELDSESSARLTAIEANNWVTTPRLALRGATPTKLGLAYASSAARTTDNGSPVGGDISYLDTANAGEGPEFYNGVAWGKAWNMPWGYAANVTRTSDVLGLNGTADITGVTLAFTTVVNRWYRMSWSFYGGNQAGAGLVEIRAYIDGVQIAGQIASRSAGTTPYGFSGFVLYSPASGPHTWKMGQVTSGGTPTMDYYASATFPISLVVEDIGPSGAPA